VDVSEVNGFCRVFRFSWDAFNEGGDVELLVENHHKLYGRYQETFPGDDIYMNRKKPQFFLYAFLEIYRNTEICLKNYFLRKYFTPKVQVELCAA